MNEGVKFNTGKPRLHLVPHIAVVWGALAAQYGVEKYAENNWRGGMKWTDLSDAASRHLGLWTEGEDIDTESGLSHLAHALICVAFLIWYVVNRRGEDDRWNGKVPRVDKKSGELGLGTWPGQATFTD